MKFDSAWNKIQKMNGWLSMREAQYIYETAKKCSGRGQIVEIGSWQGKSTTMLASGSEEGAGIRITAIDPHMDSYVHKDFVGTGVSTFDAFQQNIKDAGISSLVEPIVEKSENAVRSWGGRAIEFLWIDGDHRYSEVKKDFDLWFPFVVEGGYVAFHDSTYDDVKSFLLKEVLPRTDLGGVCVVDSIVGFQKINFRTLEDKRAANRAAHVLWAQDFLRKITPSFMRKIGGSFARKLISKLVK